MTLDGDAGLRRGPRIRTSRLRVEISKDAKAVDLRESLTPSAAVTPTWRPSVPPRGRPQLHFNVPSVSPQPAQVEGQGEVAISPMPLPARPGQHTPPPSEKPRAAPGNTTRKDARPKPYVLETPTASPHYAPNGMFPSRR